MTLAQAYLIHQTTNRTLPCGLIDYIHRCGNLGINRLIVMCKIRQEIFCKGKRPLNTGAAPRIPIRVPLSGILEANPAQKYYLSKTACISFVLTL